MRAQGWLVIFLGANQDAFAEGGKIGTKLGTTMSYGMQNMAQTMASASASTMRFAASGGSLKAAEFTDEEREKSGG
jgi:hypothetical protein